MAPYPSSTEKTTVHTSDSSPLPALFNHGLLHFTVDDGLAFELPPAHPTADCNHTFHYVTIKGLIDAV